MSDTPTIGTVFTIVGSAIGTMLAVMGFFIRHIFERIIGAKEIAVRAEAKAEIALQELAEVKSESRETRKLVEEMALDTHDQIDRMARAAGENNAAIRAYITENAFFVRDNFPLKKDVTDSLNELKKSQHSMEEKIDDIRDRLPRKTI